MGYYQGEVFEKKTCPATGKTLFPTKADAEEVRARFISFSKVKIEGKRVKHRAGKPQLKRSYFCELCEGWHLTSMHTTEVSHNKRRQTLIPERIKKFKY